MPLPASILTPDAAAAYVDQAAVLAGLPRAAWDDATDAQRQGALDAAWLTIAAQPGYYLACAAGDQAVRLAVVVEALVRLDVQRDAGAAARSRLAAQGVENVSLGQVGERYGRRPALHPATKALLAPYRGAVRMA
ncbi:MAG: hypothetical protein LOD90_00505 [Symbiobacteriaceae bacterium]